MADQVKYVVRKCKTCRAVFAGKRCMECHKRISREYAERNSAVVKAKAAAKRKADAEVIREARKAWREANPEKVRAQKAKYSAENSGKVVARVKEWRKANPSRHRIQNQNYRALKRAGGRLSPDLADRLYREQNGSCACCWRSLADGYAMDHIVPLSRGGLNVDSNIQLLTPLCNGRKHARTMAEYEAQYGEENGYGLV